VLGAVADSTTCDCNVPFASSLQPLLTGISAPHFPVYTARMVSYVLPNYVPPISLAPLPTTGSQALWQVGKNPQHEGKHSVSGGDISMPQIYGTEIRDQTAEVWPLMSVV
jgi:hypothetical protein